VVHTLSFDIPIESSTHCISPPLLYSFTRPPVAPHPLFLSLHSLKSFSPSQLRAASSTVDLLVLPFACNSCHHLQACYSTSPFSTTSQFGLPSHPIFLVSIFRSLSPARHATTLALCSFLIPCFDLWTTLSRLNCISSHVFSARALPAHSTPDRYILLSSGILLLNTPKFSEFAILRVYSCCNPIFRLHGLFQHFSFRMTKLLTS
jgi:hypothetical protein